MRLTSGGVGRDGVELRVGRAGRVGLHDRPCRLCVIALQGCRDGGRDGGQSLRDRCHALHRGRTRELLGGGQR